MSRKFKGLLLAFVALAFIALPAAGQSVAGKWTFTMETPQGTMESTFIFEQDGTEVTGTADLVIVEESEITDGLFEDGVLSFLLHVGMEGQWFTVEMEADVDGDEMSGETYVAEMAQSMPFTAKRAES